MRVLLLLRAVVVRSALRSANLLALSSSLSFAFLHLYVPQLQTRSRLLGYGERGEGDDDGHDRRYRGKVSEHILRSVQHRVHRGDVCSCAIASASRSISCSLMSRCESGHIDLSLMKCRGRDQLLDG